MAAFVLTDPIIVVGGVNLTASSTQVALSSEYEAKDATTFHPTRTSRTYLAGLGNAEMNVSGFYHAGSDSATPSSYNPGEALMPYLGTSDVPVTVAMNSAVGSVAYFMTANEVNYQILGDIGEITPFQMSATSTSKLVRGYTMLDPFTAITNTSGNSSTLQLPAVSSTQRVYAQLHFFGASSSVLTGMNFKVQSDDNSGFTSPTDRITFDSVVGGTPTYQASSVAGAITDTYWRVNYTFIVGSPSYVLALVTLGIA